MVVVVNVFIVIFKNKMNKEKIVNPLNPSNSLIKITVESDTRQVGTSFIAHAFARFLAQEGYNNVHLKSYQSISCFENKSILSKEWIDIVYSVKIVISDKEVVGLPITRQEVHVTAI